MAWLCDDLIAQRPDLIVIAGDFYHQRATPIEERYAQEWLRSIVAGTGRDVWILRGNHDDGDQLDVLGATATSGGEVLSIRAATSRNFQDIRISMLPWPDLGQFSVSLPTDSSIAGRREAAELALLDVIRGFRTVGDKTPHVLIAHANVLGASLDSGQPVASGNEISVTAGNLMEAKASIIVLGHIHAGQSLVAPVPIFYCGSLFRTTFGESSGRKGYSVLEWTGSKWRIEGRAGPARPMVLLNAKWVDGALTGFEEHEPLADAEVRLRIEFQPEDRDAVRARAWELKTQIEGWGAYSVVIEERPLLIARTRCAEVAAAKTTADKLSAWAQAAGVEAGLPGALSKLSVLEPEMRP